MTQKWQNCNYSSRLKLEELTRVELLFGLSETLSQLLDLKSTRVTGSGTPMVSCRNYFSSFQRLQTVIFQFPRHSNGQNNMGTLPKLIYDGSKWREKREIEEGKRNWRKRIFQVYISDFGESFNVQIQERVLHFLSQLLKLYLKKEESLEELHSTS